MTIKRGQSWGEPKRLPRQSSIVDSDADLADAIARGLRAGGDVVVGVTAGDLHRTLGSPDHSVAELRSGGGMGFPIDIGIFETDEPGFREPIIFVGHVVATAHAAGTLWRGRTIICMNAAFRGSQNLAPRGHPNDGRLDVTDGALGFMDRRRALKRTSSGSHLPHPDLHASHIRERRFESDSPLHVEVDGKRIGSVRSFTLRCVPDAATIIV